jgi:hypothetical protein
MFSNVCSKFRHGIPKPAPRYIGFTIKSQEFGLRRCTHFLPNSSSGGLGRIFGYFIATL